MPIYLLFQVVGYPILIGGFFSESSANSFVDNANGDIKEESNAMTGDYFIKLIKITN